MTDSDGSGDEQGSMNSTRIQRALDGEAIANPTPTEAFVVAQEALATAEEVEARLDRLARRLRTLERDTHALARGFRAIGTQPSVPSGGGDGVPVQLQLAYGDTVGPSDSEPTDADN